MDRAVETFMLHAKNVDMKNSAVAILKEAYVVAKDAPSDTKDTLELILCRLAAGIDGVSGTADDRISRETLNNLLTLVHTGMARDFVDLFDKTVFEARSKCCFM